MSRTGLVVAVFVGCSSGSTQAPSPRGAEPSSSSEAALAFGSCPAPQQPLAVPDDPVQRPTPGRGPLSIDGLVPREEPEKGKTCQAARVTLDTQNTKILAAPKPLAASGVPAAWDRKTDPARWARVAQRYGLEQRHRAQLARDGFVVAKGATHWGYVEAYHEIFQSQLPIYVSIDSVMHAIYASHAGVVADVEHKLIEPKLHRLLEAMHCQIATVAASWPREIAHDVDLYLTIARNLLETSPYSLIAKDGKLAVPSLLGSDAEVRAIVSKLVEAKGFDELELFGRKRVVDFGAFLPRGRYLHAEQYFRAMSWLSRIEFNLVSRSSRSSTMRADPSETPREAAVALALTELAQATSMLSEITAIDDVWAELAGARADVSFAELAKLRDRAGITKVSLAAQPALASTIGGGYRRAIPTQPHPDGLVDLPVIATMFGVRINPDTAALAPVIQPAVPHRIAVGAADVAYLLGHDRAKHHLARQLAEFPELDNQLRAARSTLDARLTGTDLYTMWLKAIRALAKPAVGVQPTFLTSEAFSDLRMSSAIAAFGQLRTSYELMAGMAYLGSGCEIPDGYVEPAADTYDALIAYAERGRAALATIDPKDVSDAQGYFTRLATTLRVLRAIVATELAGQPLTDAQKQWLSMVVEIVMRNASGAPPTYAGWYFDLFRNFGDATSDPDFVTGFAQSASETMYLGASAPRIGVFVVDTGGPPRVMVGPIAHAWETSTPASERRLTYDRSGEGPTVARSEPWAAGYAVEAPAGPKLVVEWAWDEKRGSGFEVISRTAVGPVTFKLLDHHRVPFVSQTKVVGPGRTRFLFSEPQLSKSEMAQLQYGTFNAFASQQLGGDGGKYSFWVTTRDEAEAIGKAYPDPRN